MVAAKKPQRSLEGIVMKRKQNEEIVSEVSDAIVQLSAIILRNYI